MIEGSYAALLGRKVLAVEGSTLYLDTGAAWFFDLDGDCCSSSSYTPEGLEAFKEIVGATITAIEDRSNWDDSERTPVLQDREVALAQKYPAAEVDRWHFLIFVTDRGHVTVDWRNESNGYYDGSVVLRGAAPLHPVTHDAVSEGLSLEAARKWEVK